MAELCFLALSPFPSRKPKELRNFARCLSITLLRRRCGENLTQWNPMKFLNLSDWHMSLRATHQHSQCLTRGSVPFASGIIRALFTHSVLNAGRAGVKRCSDEHRTIWHRESDPQALERKRGEHPRQHGAHRNAGRGKGKPAVHLRLSLLW